MDPVVSAALASWSPPFFTIATLLVTTALYFRGFSRLHRQMPRRFPSWRGAAFLAGIATLLIAIASPLEQIDDLLLSVHMLQHLMLMLVAPTLLLAGAPMIPLVRGLPPVLAKSVLGPLFRSGFVREIFRWLSEPIVGWIAFATATWVWHLPAPFQLAIRSEPWHAMEHACFFGSALMFWWPVIQPWPSVARWPRWAVIPYLLLADGQNTILAAIFMFSDRLIYPIYAMAPRVAGISALSDQVVAGAIMWVPASLFYLVPGAAIVFRMLSPRKLTIAGSAARKLRDPFAAQVPLAPHH
jgi:putative membrane protein